MPSDKSSSIGLPMTSTSSKKSLYSLGHKINFLDNWLQLFHENYQNRISIHTNNMSELFKIIPKSLPPKKVMIIKKKI